jgi:hypothetical protein
MDFAFMGPARLNEPVCTVFLIIFVDGEMMRISLGGRRQKNAANRQPPEKIHRIASTTKPPAGTWQKQRLMTGCLKTSLEFLVFLAVVACADCYSRMSNKTPHIERLVGAMLKVRNKENAASRTGYLKGHFPCLGIHRPERGKIQDTEKVVQ